MVISMLSVMTNKSHLNPALKAGAYNFYIVCMSQCCIFDSYQEQNVAAVTDFIFLGSKIIQMVNAAMIFKDPCSLEGQF